MLNCFAVEGKLKERVVLTYDENKKVSKAVFRIDNLNKVGKKEYHNTFCVVVYGKKAEDCAKALSVGTRVTVSGTLSTWGEVDQNGNKVAGNTLNANNVHWD